LDFSNNYRQLSRR